MLTKQLIFYILLWISLLLSHTALAQDQSIDYQYFDKLNDKNQVLYNGKKYLAEHTQAKGSPFLYDHTINRSSVYFKDNYFSPVALNYNIFNQFFTICFTDLLGSQKELILPNRLIDTVWIQNQVFITNSYNNIKTPFIEIIDGKQYDIIISRTKDYSLNTSSGSAEYTYSKTKKTSYLVVGNQLEKFRHKRTLIKAFPKAIQGNLKSFLKDNNIKIKKATNLQLKYFIDYCDRVSN